MKRIYCYVDESGQDTRGALFVVAIVMGENEIEPMRQACERIEQETGKRAKWIKTRYARRLAYARRVMAEPALRHHIYSATYLDRHDYFHMTLTTITEALATAGPDPFLATIRVDGLPRAQERQATLALRRMGVAGGRVKGVRRDENDSLVRLADAVCGLCRAAREGQPEP